MQLNKKRSFFERLTGGIRMDDDFFEETGKENSRQMTTMTGGATTRAKEEAEWHEEESEGQLTVDVYQTANEIIIETMVAGVRPEEIQISIARDMITIKGKRDRSKMISENDYFTRELYWGAFTRTILLPQEVEPEGAEAIESHGLLMIKLPKLDKGKKSTIKVKSI